MTTICKCFAVLVAAGQGQKCNQLREVIRDTLLQPLPSGLSKAWVHKFGRKEYPAEHQAIRKEIAEECSFLYYNVPKHFFAEEKK